jgi:hypothetical protein
MAGGWAGHLVHLLTCLLISWVGGANRMAKPTPMLPELPALFAVPVRTHPAEWSPRPH